MSLGILAALLIISPPAASAPAIDWDNLASLPGPAPVAGKHVIPLSGWLSVWSQEPGGIPVPLVKNDPVSLPLDLPEKAGDYRSVQVRREFATPQGVLKAQVDFYALCPPSPQGGCAGRYFSVQVELSGAAAALCSSSVNQADFSPFPVLACGAPAGGKRIGLTLHRTALP